jgi:gamma-glutamyltranspeptidase/glutathione hydrolase
VRFPDGRSVSVNASGPAARAADAGEQRTRGAQMPATGPDPITVPGVVAGWQRLHALGATLDWDAAFAEARRRAEDGVAISSSLAAAIDDAAADISADPGMSAVFRPGGTLRQPALARTLAAIAEHGAGELYAGGTGARLVAGLRARGSRIDADDLAGFEPEDTAPLAGRFRDLTLLTSPPNSSGVLLLQALAALEAAGPDDPLGPGAGVLADLLRLGAVQREALLADPRWSPTDLDAWLGEERIAELVSAAGLPRAAGQVTGAQPTGDTVAVVAADSSGLAVSLIQSLFGSFGSRLLEPSTGVLLHNRGSSFSLVPGHPNELAGGKRPSHTLMPLVVERDGALAGVLGTMGGTAHAQIHAQILLRLLSGSDPAAAVAAPRWVVGGLDPGAPDTVTRIESGLPTAAVDAIARAGMHVTEEPWPSEELGHAHAIWLTGERMRAGSDPRSDGAAICGG